MKKITIFSLLLIAFVLSACYKSEVKQSVYSDGSMVVKTEYDYYDLIKMSIESDNEEIPDEYEDLDDYVLSTIKDSCEEYKKESEYDLELGLIFSSCSVNEEGKMIQYDIFLPGTINIEKNDDIHTFSIINLVDYLDLPIPYEDDEYNENFEFHAGADKFYLESASLNLDGELSPVSGDFELDVDIDFKLLFEGEIIHADIGEVNNNELVFNFEELFLFFHEGSSPKVKIKVNETQSIIDEYTINYKIENINKVLSNVDLGKNNNFFEKLKSNWYLDDSDLNKILNNDSSSSNIYLNRDYYEHDDYYEYKLLNLITTISEGSQLDFIKLKSLNPESKFNIVISFENEILESSIGTIENKKLIISSNELELSNNESIVKIKKNDSQSESQPETQLDPQTTPDEPDPQPTPEPSPQPQPSPPTNISNKTVIKNQAMHNNLKGRILLQVESAGEAYYVHPSKSEKHFLGRPDDAFSVMREQGIGISNENLAKIPVSLDHLSGPDTSGDGLPDAFKEALGLDINSTDSDGDGYDDFTELTHGYDPLGPGKLNHDLNFAKSQAGRILLQVEQNGEAWYVSPENNKRYFLGRPNDAFNIMRNLGLGISNDNLERMTN